MKSNEPLIPLAGVRLVPPGVVRALFVIGLASFALALGMILSGLVVGRIERVWAGVGVCAWGVYCCGIAIYGDRRHQQHPRAHAPLVFAHVQPRPPLPLRTVAVAYVIVVLGVGCASSR